MRNMLRNLCMLAVLLPLVAAADATAPVGVWKTIDDVTGKPKALVEITEANGELSGHIIRLFPEPGHDPNPLCVKCTDARHGQPILGMTIINGLRADGDKYDGGYILDPNNGSVYHAKLHLVEGGQQLEVRGYIGISLLGRTQVWQRAVP